MKKQFLAPITIAFLLAPLGMNRVNANPQIDNNQEAESQTIQICGGTHHANYWPL